MDNSKPKIAMITMCIGAEYQKKWESAARSKEIYCKMHGYCDESGDDTRNPSKCCQIQTWPKFGRVAANHA